MVNGKMIKCTALVYICGMMEGNMKANIILIRNQVSVNLHGKMAKNMSVNLKMENNMAKARL